MQTAEWSVTKAAGIGAACGVAYAVVPDLLGDQAAAIPSTIGEWAGALAGGAIGGGFLFATVVAMRNYWAR